MKHILIDIDDMIILKVVEGDDCLRRCEYWADILIPKKEFYVCGDAKRDLATFSFLELQILHRNQRNKEIMGTDYGRAVEQLHEVIEGILPDPASLGDLVKKLGKPLKKPDFTPVAEKPEPKSKQIGGIPTRPKAGTMTAQVWEAADYFYGLEQYNDSNCKTFRDAVIDACVDGGLNASTASTQFAKWKKALNAS